LLTLYKNYISYMKNGFGFFILPDGALIMELDEDTIVSTFNITDPLHQRALFNAIATIKLHGVKPASNLWEFKVLTDLQ